MRFAPLLFASLFTLSSCSSLYYSGMKKLGKEKREILVGRIEDGKEAQQEAAKEFKNALEAFQSVTGFDGGDLEKLYKNLEGEYERVDSRAKKVTDKIQSIDKVATDLFTEWNAEIAEMGNRTLRADSEKLLRETQAQHRSLMRQMRSSEAKMQPVLRVFRDQVLYLKHNLNARALTSLKKSVGAVDGDVAALIRDIELSTKEADKAIAHLKAPTT
ncbi:DNA repair ATPase [Bryobacterales bacterium F-183]|nr:DNA repair ATPase [Bryobacterales bacterium F-183]